MGCCLFAIIAAIWPRLALVGIWLLAPQIPGRAYQTRLWPVLGFFFVPTTTLAYELMKYYWQGVNSPLAIVLLGLALLHDVGHLRGFARRRRGRGE